MEHRYSAPSRADDLAGSIESRIEREGLPPGHKIGTKEDLRTTSGMARATVNEAVRLLHDRGRVVVKPGPGGGIFVAETNPNVELGRLLLSVCDETTHVSHLIAVRDHLEAMVLAEAVEHRSDNDLLELDLLIENLRKQHEIPGGFLLAIWDLHERIAMITPNRVLEMTYRGLIKSLRDRVKTVERTPKSNAEHLAARIQSHQELVDVIRQQDQALVAGTIERHNQRGN